MEMEPKRHDVARSGSGSSNAYPPIYGDFCISHTHGWFQLLKTDGLNLPTCGTTCDHARLRFFPPSKHIPSSSSYMPVFSS
jgi:hypothetical protein